VLGTVVHTRDAEELRYVVLKELTDRYAEKEGISVTPEEIQSYVRRVQETLRRDRDRQAARRDELTRRLAAGGLSEAERKSLVAELDTVNRTIEALAPSGGTVPDPEETRAREQVAAAFISQWKINQPDTDRMAAGSSSSRGGRSRWTPTVDSSKRRSGKATSGS
jgi:hypothetical protein